MVGSYIYFLTSDCLQYHGSNHKLQAVFTSTNNNSDGSVVITLLKYCCQTITEKLHNYMANKIFKNLRLLWTLWVIICIVKTWNIHT